MKEISYLCHNTECCHYDKSCINNCNNFNMQLSSSICKDYTNQPTDQVNSPAHYNQGKIEVIEAIEDWQLNFNLGNAIKYIARCEHKENKEQDLKKAIWYIERELKNE